MDYPSVETICDRLNVGKAIASQVRGIIDGSTDPMTVGVNAILSVKNGSTDPSDENTVKLLAIDELLGSQGVVGFPSAKGDARYCRKADPYAPTVIYFSSDRSFCIGAYAYHLVSD